MNAQLSRDGRTIVVSIPISFRRKSSRKRIIVPEGANNFGLPRSARNDSLILAIARGFMWRSMLENGEAGSVRELATREKVDDSYMARLLRITLLAPDIVEAVLNGHQPDKLTLNSLSNAFPVRWDEQRAHFGFVEQPA
ncbi:MAG: hypothetical protein HQL72_02515 [Magnetococcales bacterium]|nr:hypothetical protein [Magnetococcales bacterium]